MATLLRLPEVATGATEAVINDWLVAEHGTVAAGEPLVVIETEKASVELEAESAAQVLTLLAAPGATVAVGAPIAVLAEPGEQVADLSALLRSLGVAPAEEPAGGVPTGEASGSAAESSPVGSRPSELALVPVPVPVSGNGGATGRVFASPLARRLLLAAGLGPTDADGTGPNGRITRRDVERAVEARSVAGETTTPAPVPTGAPTPVPTPAAAARQAPTPARTPEGAEPAVTLIPHTTVRRAIARRLTESKRTVPHFYLKASCEMDALLALRQELNAAATARISVNDLLVKAVGRAHTLVPEMNVAWSDEALLSFGQVDVGVAVAGARGLVTPVVRAVDTRSVAAVSAEVRELSARADGGRLRQADLEGGSITLTNLGMYGVEEFAAIINPPQAAILAVGAGRPVPAVVDGELRTRTELTAVLSVDHRCVDGALAARWMQAFQSCLAQPLAL
ncbi:MAG TPA: dihydrolipoamide acetyltransferase family protein, partial [Pseudonocardia sp.]|nr:dihydrolipoamide acetyltransferase family protein [Pseudonocardia sp.]